MKKTDTKSLVLLGLLSGIVILFCFTPIGSIPIGPLSITLNIIPIAIAAIALGPIGGLIVGSVFGLFSFLQCYGIGINSLMGNQLVNISPVLAFLQRFVPRALDGFLVGLIYRKMAAVRSQKTYYIITGIVSALFGVAVVLSGLQLFFSKSSVDPETGKKVWARTEALENFLSSGLLIYFCIILAVLFFVIGYMLVSSQKLSRTQVCCGITGFCSAFLNTLFFMAALVILFGNTDYVKDLISSKGGGNVIIFVIVFVGINALFEMVASTVVSTAVGSSLINAKLIKAPVTDKAEQKEEKAPAKAAASQPKASQSNGQQRNNSNKKKKKNKKR